MEKETKISQLDEETILFLNNLYSIFSEEIDSIKTYQENLMGMAPETQNVSAIVENDNFLNIYKNFEQINELFNKKELNSDNTKLLLYFLIQVSFIIKRKNSYTASEGIKDNIKTLVNNITFINPNISETGKILLKINNLKSKLKKY